MSSPNMQQDACPHQQKPRQPLLWWYRWMQAAFLVVFANDVYCFSSSYSFLPQHLALAGHTTLQTSMAFGSYGIVSIGVLILLLYINSTASGSSVSLNVKFFILLASTVACGLGSLLVTFLPNSYAWLVASKGIQGAASAVYFSYAFILISAIYPMEYQAQTAAFVTAGLTLGDSTGPVVAGVVYDKVGLQAAYASQLLPNLLALLALLPLLAWDKRAWGEQRTALDAASCEDQAAQQPPQLEGGKHVSQQADASSSDDVAAAQDCCVQGGHAMPAGECRHSDMAITVPEDAAGACKPICDSQGSMPDQSPCFSRSPQLQGDILAQPPAEPAAATQADSWKAAGSKQLSGPASPHSPAAAVWRVLRCRPVLSECLLVLTCQVARTALDILVPLVLAELSTSTIAVVFAAEALGSVVAPFVADMAVQVHGVSSRKAVLWTMTLMSAVTACVLYLGHHPLCGPLAGLCPRDSQGGVLANLPWGLAALMLLFGACHSSAETLIFGHLAQHLHEERASGGGAGSMSTDVTMNVYVLFWMSGFTVGAYVAGIPAEEAFWQQAVVAGVLGLLLLLSAVAVNVPHLLRQRRRA